MIPEPQNCSPADAVGYNKVAKDGVSLESELRLLFDVVQQFSCWMWSTRKKTKVQGKFGL